MAIDDGGPAFPRPISGADKGLTAPPNARFEFSTAQTGMTLRDYIAAKVLHAMLGNNICINEIHDATADAPSRMALAANIAFEHADAFLAVRKIGVK